MEDRVKVLDPYRGAPTSSSRIDPVGAPDAFDPSVFIGLFDGHGGAHAAEFAANTLHKNLRAELARLPRPHLTDIDDDEAGDDEHTRFIANAFTAAYQTTDRQLDTGAPEDSTAQLCGCTAVCCLLVRAHARTIM